MNNVISVITPAFNAEATIERAVSSVLRQTLSHWEMLIISDDGRDYRALLEARGIRDPRLRFFHSQCRASRPNATRNIGLKHATGDIIAPLDADDFYYPERFARLLPMVNIYGLAADNVDVCDEIDDRCLYRPLKRQSGYGMLSVNDFVALSTPMLLMIKRALIACPWNPDVRLGEDTLFNLRAMEAAGAILPVCYEPLHSYRIHDQSICHKPDAGDRAEAAYSFCLAEMSRHGMGFKTRGMRAAITAMLDHKRQINRDFIAAQSSGFRGSFQDFIANSLTSEEPARAVVN